MARLTKMKTRQRGGATEVLVLVNHPMETGRRVDKKTKKTIPAHYIQKMVFELNGKQIAVADTGSALSKNPLIGLRLKGAKAGDTIKVSWTDNKRESGGASTTVA